METLLNELKGQKQFLLSVTLSKTQIMSNRADMIEVTNISDAKVLESIQYLGVELHCDRQSYYIGQTLN